MIFCGRRASLAPSLENWGGGIDAAVAQEGPVAARFLREPWIALNDQDFFLVGGAFGEHAAKRVGNERVPPEFQAAFRRALKTHAIYGRHENSVGDGVRALDSAPGIQLSRAEFLFL